MPLQQITEPTMSFLFYFYLSLCPRFNACKAEIAVRNLRHNRVQLERKGISLLRNNFDRFASAQTRTLRQHLQLQSTSRLLNRQAAIQSNCAVADPDNQLGGGKRSRHSARWKRSRHSDREKTIIIIFVYWWRKEHETTVRVAEYEQLTSKNEIKLVRYIGYNNKLTY